jgi:hypothetical protein
MRHNKRCGEFTCIIVAIPLVLDTGASNDNEHNEPGNLQHHVLLVVLIEAHVALLAEQPLIFNMFNDVLMFNTPIALDV